MSTRTTGPPIRKACSGTTDTCTKARDSREDRRFVRSILRTGRVVRSVPLDDSYFGEGLALLGGKLYQLTWRSNKGFVYDLKTFERVGEFGYGGEGWGLATDGTSLYQSDGTEKIRVIDPETFRTVRTIEVCTDRSRVPISTNWSGSTENFGPTSIRPIR